jgi:hypothetical protein
MRNIKKSGWRNTYLIPEKEDRLRILRKICGTVYERGCAKIEINLHNFYNLSNTVVGYNKIKID